MLDVGGREEDFDISDRSGGCDLNPKKKRFGAEERRMFPTVKMHMDSGLKVDWALAAIKCS